MSLSQMRFSLAGEPADWRTVLQEEFLRFVEGKLTSSTKKVAVNRVRANAAGEIEFTDELVEVNLVTWDSNEFFELFKGPEFVEYLRQQGLTWVLENWAMNNRKDCNGYEWY